MTATTLALIGLGIAVLSVVVSLVTGNALYRSGLRHQRDEYEAQREREKAG